MVKKAKTVEETKKEFFEQARAFRDGKRKQYPDILEKPRWVIREALPPPPPGKPSQAQLQYQETIRQEEQMFWNMLFFSFGIRPDEPSSWELLAYALVKKHVPAWQTTDKPPWESRGPGGPRTRRESGFMVDLLDSVEKSRASYAAEKNMPIEEVADKTAVWNLPDEFRQRWPQTNKQLLTHATLYARYGEVKKYQIAAREWGLRPTPLQELGMKHKNVEPEY